MKTANTAILIGVLAYGLLSLRTPLHAQPTPMSPPATSPPAVSPPAMRPPMTPPLSTNSPIGVEGDDRPWNQGVPVATRQAARKLFLDGNRLFNIPLFTRAAEKYIAALGKWKHPAFYFNLALAQLNLGQDVEARDNLEQALKYGEEPLGPDQYKEARKQLQEVEHQLGRIRVTCSTQGADVTLDGATLFTGPGRYEGWATAKDHEITAKKPNYLPQARRVAVSPGKLQAVDLQLVTLSEAADTGRRWATWKPWAVIGAGVMIATGSGVLHALAANNFSKYDQQFQQQSCAKSGGCTDGQLPSNLSSQLSRATREQQIAVAGYIASGSAIAAGVVLLYLNRPRLHERESMNELAGTVMVIPTVYPDMLGIQVNVSH